MALNVNEKQPQDCTNITDVRNEIDRIDATIIELLGKRFDYVREVVKYKAASHSGIEAVDRKNAVIATRREWAEQAGVSPDVVEGIYTSLINYFIDEEKKIMKLKL